jgi:hypothetical protein
MSLADFQDAWNQLLFDENAREAWSNGNAFFPGLNEAEIKSINSLPEERINLIAPSTVRGRSHVFFHSIPLNIASLIPEETRKKLAHEYSVNYPDAGLHPRFPGQTNWLEFLKNSLYQAKVPHLEDLFNYEIALSKLQFYRLPLPREVNPGPKLAERAGLFSAGPDFNVVLGSLKKGLPVCNPDDSPKHGYLVARGPAGVKAEKLHWTIFEILGRCNGFDRWPEIVAGLVREENSLAEQVPALNAWENYYLKEGIIF